MHAQSCEWCATAFIAQTSKARFCSGACRSAASKARLSVPTAVPDADPSPPGPIREGVDAWLVSHQVERHALAKTVRSLADRVDAPGWYGLAESMKALRDLLELIEMTPGQLVEATPLRPVE